MGKRNENRLGYKKTKLGWIPDEWQLRTIGELTEINPRRAIAPMSTRITFLAMSDISDDGRILRQRPRRYSEVCNGYTAFKNGDVVIAKITPCFENGKGFVAAGLMNGVGFGSTEFHVL